MYLDIASHLIVSLYIIAFIDGVRCVFVFHSVDRAGKYIRGRGGVIKIVKTDTLS